MSTSYYFVCHDAKLVLWVGQTSGDGPLRLYNGEDHHEAMKVFLQRVEGRPILFVDCHSEDLEMAAAQDYEAIDVEQMARIRSEVRGEK